MTERKVSFEIGDLWLEGWVIVPAKPNLTLAIGFKGESERIAFRGPGALDDVRSLHYALGRIIEKAERLCADER